MLYRNEVKYQAPQYVKMLFDTQGPENRKGCGFRKEIHLDHLIIF